MAFKPELATNLGELADRIGELEGIPSRVSGAIAEDFTGFIADCFAAQESPDGDAWEPLAELTVQRKGHGRALYESGALEAGSYAAPRQGAGVQFFTEPVGFFHQAGTVNHEARKFLPDGDELPAKWEAAVDARISEAFKRSMGGK